MVKFIYDSKILFDYNGDYYPDLLGGFYFCPNHG